LSRRHLEPRRAGRPSTLARSATSSKTPFTRHCEWKKGRRH
jgi:hypothetical protein